MTLGQLFQQKRQESGRSLEQLAALTKIYIKILGALEEDKYGDLPARAFTRGFIVNYAKALKLNPDEVLKEHHDFLEARFSERTDRDKGHQGYVFEGKELEQNRRWLVIGGGIAVVFAAATLLVFKPGNHKHKEQHKEFEEETQLDANGDPVESTPAPPTLKGTPMQVIPYAPIDQTQPNVSTAAAASGSPNSSVVYNASPAAPVIPLASPAAATAPAATPAPSIAASPAKATPSPAPKATPTPAPKATPSVTPPPSVTAVAGADASPSPAAKEDKLNKGDALDPKEVKIKAQFQAKEDSWIRYKSDDKPVGMLILRKDRYLVIKAKSKLLFETSHPENLRYKSKSGYVEFTQVKGEVSSDASITEYSGDALGSAPMPETVPLPASH